MFTEQDYQKIKQASKEGLSLNSCASCLDMTYSNFITEYEEDEEAQKAFEKGRMELEMEIVLIAKSGLQEGDAKKFEFFTDKVLNMNSKVKVDNKSNNKKSVVPKELLDTRLILEIDDDEVQREIELERLAEESKKAIIEEEVEEVKNDKKHK